MLLPLRGAASQPLRPVHCRRQSSHCPRPLCHSCRAETTDSPFPTLLRADGSCSSVLTAVWGPPSSRELSPVRRGFHTWGPQGLQAKLWPLCVHWALGGRALVWPL